MTPDADSAAALGPPLRVRLPAALIQLFPDADRLVEVHAADMRGVVSALDARWPGMADRLTDERPAIRRHINVFVDGERVGLEARLQPGADVFILTAISGG